MNKHEISQKLISHHNQFIACLESIPYSEVILSKNGKWSPAQQLVHIVKSVAPVRLAFIFPSFLLKIIFGSANRPSKTYDALISKYHAKLAAGGKASARFVPQLETTSIEKNSKQLQQLIKSLTSQVNSFEEDQLDRLILPHPLLGKLTLREMLYFTIYHVEHHQKQVEEQRNRS